MVMHSGRAVVAAAVAAVMTAGCSLTLMAPIVVDGQSFPVERAPQLRAGMSSNDVGTLLGAPLGRLPRGDTAVWSYDER
jgi:outer membrane protein assembly factor BamE (lipoprotein component of BamABCDE complex)